jgi:hypothetical protein
LVCRRIPKKTLFLSPESQSRFLCVGDVDALLISLATARLLDADTDTTFQCPKSCFSSRPRRAAPLSPDFCARASGSVGVRVAGTCARGSAERARGSFCGARSDGARRARPRTRRRSVGVSRASHRRAPPGRVRRRAPRTTCPRTRSLVPPRRDARTPRRAGASRTARARGRSPRASRTDASRIARSGAPPPRPTTHPPRRRRLLPTRPPRAWS